MLKTNDLGIFKNVYGNTWSNFMIMDLLASYWQLYEHVNNKTKNVKNFMIFFLKFTAISNQISWHWSYYQGTNPINNTSTNEENWKTPKKIHEFLQKSKALFD